MHKRKHISARIRFISITREVKRNQETRGNSTREKERERPTLCGRFSAMTAADRGDRYFRRMRSIRLRAYFAPVLPPVVGCTFIDVRRLRGVLVTVEFEGPRADLGILPGIGRGAPRRAAVGPLQMVVRETKQKEARTCTHRIGPAFSRLGTQWGPRAIRIRSPTFAIRIWRTCE